MVLNSNSPLALFYPTSPVHVRDMRLLMHELPRWRSVAVLYRPLAQVAPGINDALNENGIDYVDLDGACGWEERLPAGANALILGAVFEHFALDLFAWAKQRNLPVIAIEEVTQLALNQLDINNYDAPFDRLFVASPEERQLFLTLGYPSEILSVSGILANDRFAPTDVQPNAAILGRLGITDGKKPIVYTTSPTRSRLALHNKDDLSFRAAVLARIAQAARRAGRTAVIKLHPNENLEIEVDKIKKIAPDVVVVGRETAIADLFSVAGVLINRGNSQTCLDGVVRGIPTVVLSCGLRTLFHDDGGAYIVEEMSSLEKTIEAALTQGAPDPSRVASKHFFRPPDGVAGFIAREIDAVTEKIWPAKEDVWNWLIRSMLFVGRHDRALALCERLNLASNWQERVRSALRSHMEARLQDAISAWLECSAHDQSWFFPHYELAHGFLASGDPKQALDHAQTAIRLHPPYHTLWHELPMRVVIMASLRALGNIRAAGDALKGLEERGLLAAVPELLIEAAAQSCFDDRLGDAERCLENAVGQLKTYPADLTGDSRIMERAAGQYIDLTRRYLGIGERLRSLACLGRLIELPRTGGWSEPIALRLRQLGEQYEQVGDYPSAEKCYTLAIESTPTGSWGQSQPSPTAPEGSCFQRVLRRIIMKMRGGPK